jgi:hypothetical protein
MLPAPGKTFFCNMFRFTSFSPHSFIAIISNYRLVLIYGKLTKAGSNISEIQSTIELFFIDLTLKVIKT